MDLSAARRRGRVTGTDRVAFLHGQCTNDIKRLRPGDHCYTAVLTAKGKMRGDAEVVCQADALVLSLSPGLLESLAKYVVTEDVVLEDVSGAVGEWAVFGEKPAGPVMFANRWGGWTVFGDRPSGVPMTADEFEWRRVAAGVPWWGVDMDETTIPVEAGLGAWAISYDKGCYIGQETIARLKTYGHVNRCLVQLRVAGATRGAVLRAEEKEVGRITSVTGDLALGYVRRELAKPGALVTVDGVRAEVIKPCGNSAS